MKWARLLSVFIIGCSGRAGEIVPPGTEGGVCYGNGTCDPGLVCDGVHCVSAVGCVGAEEVLLWSTSFEPGESAPASVTGDGGPTSASDVPDGTRLVSVSNGTMEIATPIVPMPSGYGQLRASYLLDSGAGFSDDRIDIYAYVDGSTDAAGVATVSLEPIFDWAEMNQRIDVPDGSETARVEMDVLALGAWADIDRLRVWAAAPRAACINDPTPGCGDGAAVAPEACDDGNRLGGDGCNSLCELEVQGHGGSSCSDARVLSLVPGPDETLVAAAQGEGSAATDAVAVSCGVPGNDEIYEVFLPEARGLRITAVPESSVDLNLVLRGPGRVGCADSGAELGCGFSSGLGVSATLDFPALTSDVYFIIVDALDEVGHYRLEVTAY